MTLDQILEEIKNAETILILAHETPDGDAIGSCLAMKLALEQIGKHPDVVMDGIARNFDFLPGRKDVKETSEIKNYDLVISLDCADFKRVYGNEYFDNAKKTIVIDHHGTNNMYGDLNFVNPTSPACCQILVGIFQYFGIEIDKEIGTCLLTGIITDTGGFKYSGVTAETFEFTEEIMQKGVKVYEVYKKALDTKTKANFELMKKVVDRMEFLEDGKVTFTYITKSDLLDVNAEPGDHEGLVNIGRDIEGVEVSIFIRQEEEKQYKISMRSNNYVNVADICYVFGGGGHEKAAGASINVNGKTQQEDIEEIKDKVLKEIKKVI